MQLIMNVTQEQWDRFVSENAEDGGLLQSWTWGEIEAAEGRTITRLAWEESGELAACCLLVERQLSPLTAGPRQRRWPFGWKYLYAPRGPVLSTKQRSNEATKQIFIELEQFAREQGAMFVRIEPVYQSPLNIRGGMGELSIRSVASVQPQQTLRIDLTQSDEQLLAVMHQKTRYNIGLAEKRGVQVNEAIKSRSAIADRGSSAEPGQKSNEANVDIFLKLLQTTTARDSFRMHAQKHYSLLTANYSLFIASLHDTPLAAAIVAFFGTTAYYLHGASANEHRDVMAPYALHWHIMREAKRRGCTVYDLWGIDEQRWPGVTRFKRGFAPSTSFTTYVGTFECPTSTFYSFYRLLRYVSSLY